MATRLYHDTFDSLFKKVGDIPIENVETVKQKLLTVTTPAQTKRALSKLNAACNWAKRQGLIKENPYAGAANELPKFRYQTDPKPNAFTEEEYQTIIEAFRNHDYGRGFSYSYYAPLVEFWFLTGCRPSEGVGLQWKHVAPDFSTISFEGSVTTAGGGSPIKVEGSKNNKKRKFPCSVRLKELLREIKPAQVDPEDLVFPSRMGKPINYSNFCKNAWDKVVDPIKPGTTPYCCRYVESTL